MSGAITIETAADEIISKNPATDEEIGRIPQADEEDVRRAVRRARSAFADWRNTGFSTRKHLVTAARDVILEEMDDIARLISAESGKPFGGFTP